MPETTFDGQYLHPTLAEMTAAHLFHIARNHPFIDGKKRTALMCVLVFMGLDGRRLGTEADASYARVDDVAAGRISKASVSGFFARNEEAR